MHLDHCNSILGECSALWGEHEGVVWCIIVFIALPRSSPPPTVACKTTGEGTPGEEAICRISNAGVCEAI